LVNETTGLLRVVAGFERVEEGRTEKEEGCVPQFGHLPFWFAIFVGFCVTISGGLLPIILVGGNLFEILWLSRPTRHGCTTHTFTLLL